MLDKCFYHVAGVRQQHKYGKAGDSVRNIAWFGWVHFVLFVSFYCNELSIWGAGTFMHVLLIPLSSFCFNILHLIMSHHSFSNSSINFMILYVLIGMNPVTVQVMRRQWNVATGGRLEKMSNEYWLLRGQKLHFLLRLMMSEKRVMINLRGSSTYRYSLSVYIQLDLKMVD